MEAATGAGTTLAEIASGDLDELAAFYAEQTGRPGGGGAPHLHWFLFENPAASDALPKGWLARDEAGQIVGAKCCSPQRFQCGGQEYTLLHGGGYYVDARRRGVGLLLMRRFLAWSGKHALFAATMNEVSGALYERLGGYPIPRTDSELIAPLRWTPLLEEALVRRGVAGPAARAAAQLGRLRPAAFRGRSRGSLARVEAPSALPQAPLPAPPEHAQQVTAVRDPAFLAWRYFAGPDSRRALYRYETRTGACWVGVHEGPRGHRQQLRTLLVLDLWGELPAEETPALATALAERHREEADLLVFRGMPPGRERALLAAGCLRRALPRPVGVCIDPAGLLPTRDWYLVPADGDMGH